MHTHMHTPINAAKCTRSRHPPQESLLIAFLSTCLSPAEVFLGSGHTGPIGKGQAQSPQCPQPLAGLLFWNHCRRPEKQKVLEITKWLVKGGTLERLPLPADPGNLVPAL